MQITSPILLGSDSPGRDPDFWTEARRIVNFETDARGLTRLSIQKSTRKYARKYAEYFSYQRRMHIYWINDRSAAHTFNSVLHELAHHIHYGRKAEAQRNKDWNESSRLDRSGRVHGLGFKEVMTELEHRYYTIGHSAWGSAGCRGSSRASRRDWQQLNKVCEESDMAKAAAKKNTAKISTPDIFKVTVNIEEAFKRPAGGIIITPHEFTVYAEAKNELAAQGKVLRAYGLSARDNVKFTVTVEAVKAPSKIKRAPLYVIQAAS